jgi:hypothetical protein
MRARRLLLYGFFVVAVSGYVYRDDVALLAATDDCDQICGPTAECDQTCYNELFVTTCGEYDGGWTNDWCDGNTCEDICGPYTGGNFVCWWDGELSTCEDFGDAAECGDEICAWVDGGETCLNCEDDCGCPPDPTPTCGQNGCEVGESWRTCPQDCDEPETDDCGDEVCGPTEDAESCEEDCNISQDLCGGQFECPEGWECIRDRCVADEEVLVCCDQSCGGPLNCDWDEYCGQKSQFPTAVCLPRWP